MLTPEQFKKLTVTNNMRPLIDITLCWLTIATALSLSHISLFFLPLVIPIIASRLHGLIVIMHDGAHYLLNRNKIINDMVSNLFCAFPLQISTEAYRKTHNWHHSHTQTMKDPNFVIMRIEDAWRFPKAKIEVRKTLLKDMFLMTMKDHMLILKDWQVLPNYKKLNKLEQLMFPVFLVGILAMTHMFGLWMDFFILQFSSLLINPIARIRAMSEHIHQESQGQQKIHKLQETPTVNANFIERFFIAPFNTNRHLEHHIYPTIPYYNLEKVHALIEKSKLYKDYCRYELDGYLMGKRNALNEVLSIPEGRAALDHLKKTA
jgi:fatty acid desaturase